MDWESSVQCPVSGVLGFVFTYFDKSLSFQLILTTTIDYDRPMAQPSSGGHVAGEVGRDVSMVRLRQEVGVRLCVIL